MSCGLLLNRPSRFANHSLNRIGSELARHAQIARTIYPRKLRSQQAAIDAAGSSPYPYWVGPNEPGMPDATAARRSPWREPAVSRPPICPHLSVGPKLFAETVLQWPTPAKMTEPPRT